MKTQISRDSFRPLKRYSAVCQQQGRMITDADWNELAAVVNARLEAALADLVGSGTPKRLDALGDIVRTPIADNLRILPGPIYADGVPARLAPIDSVADPTAPFLYTEQADFPSPPPLPTPTRNFLLYLDLWERPVVSLEDPGLRDPALHGADTTTRTQTMAQVKWCRLNKKPDDPASNPPKGTAPLTLVLRQGVAAADPCDPCASQVELEGDVGNRLFRVEVHDVVGQPAAPTQITLKWSAENGAEQYEVDTLPDDFVDAHRVYEFFNATTEKTLGVHLATGYSPPRRPIDETYPSTNPAGFPWVRRWDGWCTLRRSGSNWSLLDGSDAGIALSVSSGANDDGHVEFGPGAQVAINLSSVVLTLALGHSFVAGDFWLAPVRRNVHEPGDTLLDARPPLGITHHYLTVAKIDAAGKVVAYTTPEQHRFAFPRLTELKAGDVGYATQCPSGFFTAVHDTVDKALNRICELTAAFVGYTPNCPSGLFTPAEDTVKKALDKICAIQAHHVGFKKPCNTAVYQGAAVSTVADALKLLCGLNATQVLFKGSDACPILADATTVAEALEALCERLLNVAEDCAGRLALFGRGVLCGLIPTIQANAPANANAATITVKANAGKFIDGMGCLHALRKGLTIKQQVASFATRFVLEHGRVRKTKSDLQKLAERPMRLSSMTLHPRLIAPMVAAIIADIKTTPSQPMVFRNQKEAVAWVSARPDVPNAEFAAVAAESILANAATRRVPAQVKLYLYVAIVNGKPALAIRSTAPAPVIPAVTTPTPGVTPTPCDMALTSAWDDYKTTACPQANDGAVCLGTIGVYGDKAIVCPDAREQILTPAQLTAARAAKLKPTYPSIAKACLGIEGD